MTIKFLDVGIVLAIHQDQLEEFGGGEEGSGHRGALDEGVDAAVQAVKNSYYEDVYELGAAYAVYIVQGHVFLDGNKRTGAAAMLTFLQFNRAAVRVTVRRLKRLMLELQERAEDREASLVEWLATEIRGH